MRAIRYFCLAILLLLSLIGPLTASFALRGADSRNIPAVQTVTLGNATVPLTGPWRFRTGDDMRWAQTDFDDSAWSTMDLTPPAGSYDPMIGTSGYVPGWTTRGYKGYSGYAWYRLRVNIRNGQSPLALKMPDNVDDVYQIYVNGKLIGGFGRFTTRGFTSYSTQPRAFPLPANLYSGPITVAIRMAMEPFTPLVDQDAGGMHGPPVLGQTSAIAALLQLDWGGIDRSQYGTFFEAAILLLALLVAFALFWLDRSEPAYLWLGLTCAALLSWTGLLLLSRYSTWIKADVLFLFRDAVQIPVIIGLWVVFWAYWFRLGRLARIHTIVWTLVALLGIGIGMLRPPLFGAVVPVSASTWLMPLTEALKLLLGVTLVWITIRGIRRDKTEGWLALPAVVLVAISLYQEELTVLHVPVALYAIGAGISISEVSTILSLVIVTVLLGRRFLRGQREREQFRLEMEQARQLQSLLVPLTAPPTPGFAVESVYLPAQQVGGDFFHLRPGNDGSLLIVMGDVSGKGLKAAMTVSTIIGALRGCAMRAPSEVLAYLNGVLHGQVKGFATCCATLISADGTMTVANAGHIPPYRNGEELSVENGLPVGIVADSGYQNTQFRLDPGDRLLFVSDGVVEATNDRRELFGFERTQQISRQAARSIAEAAQRFGQQDDITVVAVQFIGVPAIMSA